MKIRERKTNAWEMLKEICRIIDTAGKCYDKNAALWAQYTLITQFETVTKAKFEYFTEEERDL